MTGPINLINVVPLQYRILILLVLFIAAFGTGWVKGAHHEELKAAKFEAATEALGKAAITHAKEIDARNHQRKKESDNAYAKTKRDLDDMYAAYASLRQQHTGSRTVSSLPTSPGSPERICFDRAKFADAVGIIEDGIPAILKQGDLGITGLNVAKAWAAELPDKTPPYQPVTQP